MHYIDDPDQLPALVDPGPRDGRHGVDRDADFEPYPPRHFSTDTGIALAVSVEDAQGILDLLLDRVRAGEEIMLTRQGRPVALVVDPFRREMVQASETVVETVSVETETMSDDAESVTVESVTVESVTVETVSTIDEAASARAPMATNSAVFPDEGDQLPELPDPGPRDGQHGVDRERRREAGRFPLSM